MPIHLHTLGGLRAVDDGEELDWLQGQRVRAALLVYLAVERTVTRTGVAALFWPESDEDNARHALRQGLYQLKRFLGDGWVDARTHDLRISDDITTDVASFEAALGRDAFEPAAQLYGGPFLSGIHLADVKPWEVWVDTRRAHLAREYRRACREWVEACRSRGDTAGAIAAAQRWLAPDPLDDEAQHTLIEVLAEAGQRTDALKQYEAYVRQLETEGLEPLDETRQLAGWIEAEAKPGPETGSLPVMRVPARPEPVPEVRAKPPPAPRTKKPPSRALRAALVFFLIGSALTLIQWLTKPEPALPPSSAVYFRGVVNRTGDLQLDALTLQLELALRQSSRIRLLDAAEIGSALAAMGRDTAGGLSGDVAREIAWRTGTPILVTASISPDEQGYQLEVEIIHVGERPTDLPRSWTRRFTASSKERIPDAVDRAGAWVRATVGDAAREIATQTTGREARRAPQLPCSACSGSMRVARIAGITPAMRPVRASSAATAMNAIGSAAWTP